MLRVKRWAWNALVNGILASAAAPMAVKPLMLRVLGADVHPTVRLPRSVDLYGSKITLGEGVLVNVGTLIQNYAPVTIGAHAQIGPRVTILTVDHEVGGANKRAVGLLAKPVTIGAGTWVGAGAIILPGVTIGEGCIVGAGAVVTRDCDPDGLYVGVPARRVRDLPKGAGAAQRPSSLVAHDE